MSTIKDVIPSFWNLAEVKNTEKHNKTNLKGKLKSYITRVRSIAEGEETFTNYLTFTDGKDFSDLDYYDRLEFFLKIGKTDLPVQLNREATRAKIASRIALFELTGSRISKCKQYRIEDTEEEEEVNNAILLDDAEEEAKMVENS